MVRTVPSKGKPRTRPRGHEPEYHVPQTQQVTEKCRGMVAQREVGTVT
jgi:hypothetical protein